MIPDKAIEKLFKLIKFLGINCIKCNENLTQVERNQGRAYCTDCWPQELEYQNETMP